MARRASAHEPCDRRSERRTRFCCNRSARAVVGAMTSAFGRCCRCCAATASPSIAPIINQGQRGTDNVRKPQDHSAPLAVAASYETALLECAAGRAGAISGIYVNEAARMRAVARRIVRDHDYADDVIHEAFAQILRDARHFDPARGSARAWIYTIVRNTALKLRQNRTREMANGAEAFAARDEESLQVARAASSIAESVDLRACLEQLEPRRRASLILAIIDGHTHQEIAAYLDVPVGTVKAWIRRELIALRRRLG